MEGNQPYLFVIDGTRWIPDPAADAGLELDERHGRHHSIRVVIDPQAGQ